ncbi:unnamed protein product [Microthlaspi erraticum]|uniref:HMG-Y-related protein A n=1 Tax=Microthlaspi erraticum TaxID=1685480 RepID=A0A6D2J1L1_9BRAS|nr:unnamed protein product [Microthlaspi erraticum]
MASDLPNASAADQHSSESQIQEQPAFSLPPYPQMIIEAIESLNDKNGSNKTTIAKHIESTQQTLPPSHSTLLGYHLNKMKSAGQLIMVKNNYMKPGSQSNAPPPKRGRGRPPKPKTQAESGVAETVVAAAVSADPPRSRGRPPKSRDPSEPPVQPKEKIASGSGRPRGRPPKKPRVDSETVATPAPEPAAQPNVERRGRGRPPKVKTTAVAPVGC